ncbi:MAG: methyltransferase domain-containing protein [Anaerolineae bacterium]|nr:methyltransferase domain-containing protein [Anaerolineae bacterium]
MSVDDNSIGAQNSGTELTINWALAMEHLRAPVLQAAVESLNLPPGSRGLDAACGIGLQAIRLAEAAGPGGHVTGLDISAGMLRYAEKMVKQAGLSERISFEQGSVEVLPFDDNSFDWAWSADFVGYAPLPPLPLIGELVRVTRPGGTVAILAWSSERLLPGYPVLEAHLGATGAGIAPFVKGKDPETHFSRSMGWLRKIGLVDIRANTFVGSAFAPLGDDLRGALTALFEMRWPGVQAELSTADLVEFRRLCLPESPD